MKEARMVKIRGEPNFSIPLTSWGKVVVEERVDGSMHIMHHNQSLKYREITQKPKKALVETDKRAYNRPVVLAKDHPWKRRQNQNTPSKNRLYILT